MRGTVIQLRGVHPSDVAVFERHQSDPEARWTVGHVAEPSTEPGAYAAMWARFYADPSIITRTIQYSGAVAGYVMSYQSEERVEIAYWVDPEHWGKGVATEAVRLFLEEFPSKPLYARAVDDNVGSVRVLEKNGFVPYRSEPGFANVRGMIVDETLFILR